MTIRHPSRLTGLLLLLLLVVLAACGGPSVTVSREDPDQEIALTDRWNSTDSRLVSQTMIEDMVTFPWYNRFVAEHGREPVVIVHSIRNRSHEHIPVNTFINDIRRAMLQTGQLDFVASGEERDDIRQERLEQEQHAREDTIQAMGQELGADFALTGEINSFVDTLDGNRVTSYQVDMRLISILDTRDVWLGTERIQKFQQRR
ncbi:penicillin-binding protein activator LpoB [Natronospirillum operosum]|uniref:Penicillin-binding protein activator LpoB n=1 Tax=Natronospirillum operosum TaxID=2759953 RepID=A0A4Z0WA74_9GAMM|nr:penicillin-binding protein activator LpoB [Natronospirillum operosum]TGG93255.1 penicillin-binding protein activator LpoB [Natronospirillum operosum]